MRPSASTDSLPDVRLRAALRVIADAGYGAVSIGLGHADEDVEELGVSLASVEVAPLSAESPAKVTGELERIDRHLAWGSRLGLRSLCLGAGHRQRQPWPLLIKALRRAAQQAATRNMTLCLANRYGSRIEQIEDLRYALPEIGAANVLIAVDTGEFHAAAVNPTHVFREFPNRIGLLKLTDRLGKRAMPLGRGEINLAAVLETAASVGYNGWIAVHTLVAPGDDAARALLMARKRTERLLGAGR